jgi:hypoxanthine phosphoribosyltransferase
MSSIVIHQKEFVPYLGDAQIQARIAELGAEINSDYEHMEPLFVGVLNGAFRFAADLMRHIEIPSEITFVKVSSYRGTKSSGSVSDHIGLNSDLRDRHIIILEDIIDTGHTIEYLMEKLLQLNPASIKVATLLHKPEAYLGNIKINYCGFEIPNLFVVGYGLDYNGQGRHLNNIYQVNQ